MGVTLIGFNLVSFSLMLFKFRDRIRYDWKLGKKKENWRNIRFTFWSLHIWLGTDEVKKDIFKACDWYKFISELITKCDFLFLYKLTRTTNVVRNAGCTHSRYTLNF